MNMLTAIKIAQTAAKKRIDFPTRPGVTFFSGQDIWLFEARSDTKVCDQCRSYESQAEAMGGLNGNFIRALFPWLSRIDENTIGGPGEGGDGLVHPNCRCRLIRYIGDPEDRVLAQKSLSESHEG